MNVGHLVGIALLFGIVISAYHPVRQSLGPRLVEPPQISSVVALAALNFNVGRVISPAIGGVLIRGVTRAIRQKLLLENVRTHANCKQEGMLPGPLKPKGAGDDWGQATDESTVPPDPDDVLLERPWSVETTQSTRLPVGWEVRSLPDDVRVEVSEDDRGVTLHLIVHDDDIGKVIGRRGRTAKALRTLIKAAGSLDDVNVNVEIED